MGNEGQGILRQVPSEISRGLRFPDAGPTPLPLANTIIECQEHSPRANILPSKLPITQSWAEPELKDQSTNSRKAEEMKSEPVSMLNVPRAEELNALRSEMSDTLTTSKLETPQNKLTYTTSLTHAQGVSSVDGAAHQVLHVHLGNTGSSMKQPQEACIPKNISRLCQDKNFPTAAKKERLTGSTPEDLARGNAGLRTSQPGSKRFPTQNLPLKERLGTKSPQTPLEKAQPPPESQFSKTN